MFVLKLDTGKEAECPKCSIWSSIPALTASESRQLNCKVRSRNSVMDLPFGEEPQKLRSESVNEPQHADTESADAKYDKPDWTVQKNKPVEFRELLVDSHTRNFAAHGFILINFFVLIFMAVAGVDVMTPRLSDLIAWGGKFNYYMIMQDEWWRLVSAFFLHSGLIHLVIDMWFLWMLGNLCEKIFGNAAFILVYIAGGLGGTITSFLVSPLVVSACASAPVLGIAGALVAFIVFGNVSVPSVYARKLVRNIAMLGVVSAIPALFAQGIDIAANIGGLAAGFGAGLLLMKKLPASDPDHAKKRYFRFFIASVLVVGILVSGGVLFAKKGEGALLPDIARFEDLFAQSKFDEAIALVDATPGILQTLPDREHIEGFIFWKKGDYDSAIKSYLELIRKHPDLHSLRLELANVYLDKLSFDDAINTLEVLVRQEPDNAVAIGTLAWAYYLVGDFDKCISLSNKALGLDKSLLYAKYNIALSMLRQGETEKARDYYAGIKVPDNEESRKSREGAISDLADLVRKDIMKNEALDILHGVFGLSDSEIDHKVTSA
jgi:rhomboid protease GluP